MWSESTRYSFSGGIEYPHFGQRVLSDAFTLSRLIFCLLGIGPANYTWVRRSRLSTYVRCALTSTISTGELLANVGIAGAPKEPAPVGVVRRAQAKIRAYHDDDMRDKQSPLAVGRWYASERILVTAAP